MWVEGRVVKHAPAIDDLLLDISNGQLNVEIVNEGPANRVQAIEKDAEILNRLGTVNFGLNSSEFFERTGRVLRLVHATPFAIIKYCPGFYPARCRLKDRQNQNAARFSAAFWLRRA